MSQHDHVINAWKSERYRTSLSDAERDQLPVHPAGIVDLTDEELGDVAGGTDFTFTCTSGSVCISVIVSCVFTCGCTNGCATPIFPCIPPILEIAE
jgi:mersacidin/lichenicidin family type 2 lantibiotic